MHGTKGTKRSLREANAQLVLQQIAAANGHSSRADIARATGLTRATVSSIVAELIDRRLVAEAGLRAHESAGKPATVLELDRANHIVVALDLSPQRVVCTSVLLNGVVDEFVRYALGSRPASEIVSLALAEVAARRPNGVLAVGIAVPTLTADETADREGLSAAAAIAIAGETVDAPAYAISPAGAAAVYEATISRREHPSIATIHLGDTLSLGIVAPGIDLVGSDRHPGDINHLVVLGSSRRCESGHAGCLNAVVSPSAILDGAPPPGPMQPGYGVLGANHAALRSRIRDAARQLAAYIDILSASTAVAEFVLDGVSGPVGMALVDSTRKALQDRQAGRAAIPRVRLAALGPDGVIFGAATHAFRQRLGVSWTTDTLTHTTKGSTITLVEQVIGGYSMERLPIARKFVSAAAAATLALAAAGCAARPAGNDTITLEVWTHEFEPLQKALTEKWIPEFEAANPGIEIKLTSIPFAGAVSYDAKLISALSSGGGPDVWDMGDWNYRTFAENGYLEPIDPEIFGYADDQEMLDAYLPGSTDALEWDGRLLGLFSEFNTLNLFYNRDVFKAAGIEEPPPDKPLSWQQVGEIGQRLRVEQGGAVERIGLQLGFFANFRSPQWYAQTYYTFLRQYGQDDIYLDGKPAANTQAAKDAFQLLHDLTFKYQAYDPNFLNNWFADVPQGRAGMVSAGTWYPAAAIQNNEDFDFGVAPQPVVDPRNPETYKNVSWLWGWSINANADHYRKKASQKFLAFMLGKKGETAQSADWFERLGYMQPSKDFLQSDAYQSALATSPWLSLWVDALTTYEVKPVPHSYDQAGSALVRAIDRVVYDGASAADTASQLQSELERIGS